MTDPSLSRSVTKICGAASQLPRPPPRPPSAVIPFRRDRYFVERPLLNGISERASGRLLTPIISTVSQSFANLPSLSSKYFEELAPQAYRLTFATFIFSDLLGGCEVFRRVMDIQAFAPRNVRDGEQDLFLQSGRFLELAISKLQDCEIDRIG